MGRLLNSLKAAFGFGKSDEAKEEALAEVASVIPKIPSPSEIFAGKLINIDKLKFGNRSAYLIGPPPQNSNGHGIINANRHRWQTFKSGILNADRLLWSGPNTSIINGDKHRWSAFD